MSGSDMRVFRKHPAFRSAHAGYLPFASGTRLTSALPPDSMAVSGHFLFPAPQRIFPACQNLGTGGALVVADPITGRAPEIRRRQWDKTSEVPQVLKHRVHGASRWWALSKAVKQHSWKRSWPEQGPSRVPAASMPELPWATPVPRRVITRWA